MDFAGQLMKGILFVDKNGYGKSGDLEAWIDLTLKYVSVLPEKHPKKSILKKRAKK